MGKALDLTGKKFGRLTALERVGTKHHEALWRCLCECGKEKEVQSSNLTRLLIRSCGCLRAEQWLAKNTTHGMTRTRTHTIWVRMRGRCMNPNDNSYGDYGGRGIKVVERWMSFQHFLDDMGECPKGYSLERDDVNGNYEPTNCRWIPRRDQANNTRRTLWLEYQGRRMNMSQWAREFEMSVPAMYYHVVKKGRTIAEIDKNHRPPFIYVI